MENYYQIEDMNKEEKYDEEKEYKGKTKVYRSFKKKLKQKLDKGDISSLNEMRWLLNLMFDDIGFDGAFDDFEYSYIYKRKFKNKKEAYKFMGKLILKEDLKAMDDLLDTMFYGGELIEGIALQGNNYVIEYKSNGEVVFYIMVNEDIASEVVDTPYEDRVIHK